MTIDLGHKVEILAWSGVCLLKSTQRSLVCTLFCDKLVISGVCQHITRPAATSLQFEETGNCFVLYFNVLTKHHYHVDSNSDPGGQSWPRLRGHLIVYSLYRKKAYNIFSY
jgi:hypothetical protein